jgi:serine/threonine protein kinase
VTVENDGSVWQLPGYELLERIALGGRGEVYLAREGDAAGPLVAIKVLRPEDAMHQDRVAAFLDEVRVSRLLVHPNVVRVYHGDIHENLPYLVMEHVDGITLWDLNERARKSDMRLPNKLSAYLVSKVAAALVYAHELKDDKGTPLNLVHRDVSAVNVMVTFDGAVKLLDFGIARSTLRSQRTAPGVIKGKLDYLSPEQCEGGTIDALTDIYSLGVLLFELITGTRPFVEFDIAKLFALITNGERPKVSSLRKDVPAELEAIVDRAMAADRQKRFRSSREVLETLEQFLAAQASPPTSSTLASTIAELAPDKVGDIDDAYGRPETVAIDQAPPPSQPPPAPPANTPLANTPPANSPLAHSPPPNEPPPPAPPTTPPPVPASASQASSPPQEAKGHDPAVIGLGTLGLFLFAVTMGITVTLCVRSGESPHVATATDAAVAADAHQGEASLALAEGGVIDDGPTPDSGRPPQVALTDDVPPDEAVATDGPPEPAPERGRLIVRVTPRKARIFLDKRKRITRRGKAVFKVPPGEYQLKITSKMYSPHVATVTVEPDESETYRVNLVPTFGYLTVKSRRRAMVYVDDTKVDLTPLRRHKVSVGRHKISVRSRRGARHRRVKIVAGEERTVRLDI